MSRRKICVVTGSRADYGLLYWVMRGIADSGAFELQVAVTGMHLSPAFGDTWRQIEQDGFPVSARVESLLAGDTATSVTKSVGLGVVGFADALERLMPDLLLVLGDRFEILAAVQAALFARIPVAHLCGGDVTEGAFDESIRHAITKMAHLHFPTNAQAARRLAAMGEDPARIFTVGSTGLDRISKLAFADRDAFFASAGMAPRRRNLLVVFHPTTLGVRGAAEEAGELLAALSSLGEDVGLLLTGANADTEGQRLNDRLRQFAQSTPGAVFHLSLGSERYLNALKHVDAIVGNSSSGLYEAPSLGLPAVNIGDRQKGRLRAASVVDCEPQARAIAQAIERALAMGRPAVANPYGDGNAAPAILQVLQQCPDFAALLRKPFHEAEAST